MASDWARSAAQDEHGGCSVCGRTDVSLKKNGTLRAHVHGDHRGMQVFVGQCKGSGQPPQPVEEVSGA